MTGMVDAKRYSSTLNLYTRGERTGFKKTQINCQLLTSVCVCRLYVIALADTASNSIEFLSPL